MKKAIVVDGVIREIVADDAQFHESILSEVPDGAQPGWTFRDGMAKPQAPPKPTWDDRRGEASFALMATDRVILRMYEDGMKVPKEWRDWRNAMRAIVDAADGDPSADVPAKPEEPKWSA